MGVAGHLGIQLEEYDVKIRTFIPYYEEMIEAAAQTMRALRVAAPAVSEHQRVEGPRVVDLGTGTGALAAACARVVPGLSITGIDSDPAILDMARSRLQPLGIKTHFVHGNFTQLTLPACDAFVSSFALHHIRDAVEKRKFFRVLHHVTAPGGMLIFVDCYPSSDAAIARLDRDAWRRHLQQTYSESEADALLASWAEEDAYVSLADEMAMLRAAAFMPHVVWRRDGFAVLAARS